MKRQTWCGVVGVLFVHAFIVYPTTAEAQQRQQFLSVPKDQKVVEGLTSVLECEVRNQRGRVQWAKDGFVLGFNRSIPGYPRYQMVGDGADGMHHLEIHNTSLADDADYQCQVGPADGHPPIRATGRLTVLLAPSSMKLHSGGREDELVVNEGDEVSLECRVENAKPVASIRWFKDDKEIKLDNRQDDIHDSSLDRRQNVVSRIAVKLTSADDASTYVCEAGHDALQQPMRASVKMSVLYPPGPPVITGYLEGESIRAEEERVLTCRSRGGNPLGRVLWYRDNVVIDTTDRQGRGESVNEYRFEVEARDNGATFSCEVKNKLTPKPLVAALTLSVHFPPEKVEVSGPSQARVGEEVTLRCVVQNANPPAGVSWMVDGTPDLRAHTTNERSGGGGWHTVSTFAMKVPEVERNVMFACHATVDALGATRVGTFRLSVLRPPQPPEIYGYSEGVGIRVGQEQGLSCVSKGGNPPAHLQWYRNGAKISSDKHSIAEVSTAKITILAEPQDNGARFRCEAHNAAASTPVSVNTTLIVHFPPDSVKVTVHPEHLRAGNQATLSCAAGPSNPPVQISWYRGDFMLKGHLQETQEAPNHASTVINVLVLNLTASDDALTYSCEALNSALQTKKRDAVTLAVSYPPLFVSPPPEVVDVVVGESMVLNLTTRANPEPVTYSWTHEGQPVPRAPQDAARRSGFSYEYRPSTDMNRARITAEGSLLNVLNVTVRDSGDYQLEASNEQGKTLAKVYINVQYPAVIKGTSGAVSVPLGAEATLECRVDGNPLREAMMEWRRPGYDFADTQQSFGRKKATLRVMRVDRNDTGVFTCVAHNGIGREAAANVSLVVNAKPIINQSKKLSLAAASLGSTGRLRCEAEGAPDIRFTWRKNAVQLPHNFYDGKFINETLKTGLVTYTSTLEVRRVAARDFGHYECQASNKLGSSTTSIHFTAPTKPQPPVSLKVVNATHDSVTLQWVPGFDGGAAQYFRLRYRTKDRRDSFSYSDVYEPDVTVYSVDGLQLGTEYYFSIMSRNEIGQSDYAAEFVRAFTSSEAPPTPVPSSNVGREGGGAPLPALWVVIVVLVATALLALNVSAIVCIIRRRRKKRGAGGGGGGGGAKKFLPPPKGVLQREPSIPLAGVSSHPSFGSDLVSSKSTSNTMYAPSSYNDTVVGETLSSISEKSRESYAQEDSVGEYEEQPHKHAGPPYLIDQIEPPPEYASQTPSSQPSSAAFDPHEDDYAEVLRRNAYNHQLGKGPPRPPSRATHYSTSPDSRGYISYSYTPSPTGGVPNGAAQYHAGTLRPSVSLGLQQQQEGGGGGGSPYPPGGEPLSVEALECQQNAIHALGLDSRPPPTMGLEQHSLPSDHLSLDHNSITIDHPTVLSDLPPHTRGPPPPPALLSTFHPNPSPSSAYSEAEMEGHLV